MAKARKRYRRGRRNRKRGFASWGLGKKIAAILGGTFALVLVAGGVILASKLAKLDIVDINKDAEALSISEEAKVRGTGYLNVALFGVDSRDNELGKGTRSDTIMIASLNLETMEVKLVSVYRDTLLQLYDGSLNKANAAYSFGGPEGAIKLLNENLDMNIEHYVTVNFNALVEVIDAVGGIEIDVQQEEISYINGYATEIIKVTGKDAMGVTEPGLQTLNGTAATGYARIRYTAGGDFRRAERQREVLTKVMEKAQNLSLSQINRIIDKVFPMISTNFTLSEMLKYAKDAFDYKLVETGGFPEDNTTGMLNGIGSVVIPQTLDTNVVKLHQFLYGDTENYTPSSTVYTISNNIAYKASGSQNSSSSDASSSSNSSGNSNYNSNYDNSGSISNGYDDSYNDNTYDDSYSGGSSGGGSYDSSGTGNSGSSDSGSFGSGETGSTDSGESE